MRSYEKNTQNQAIQILKIIYNKYNIMDIYSELHTNYLKYLQERTLILLVMIIVIFDPINVTFLA